MRYLIFCVALLGCDMPKMGSFYTLQAGERNPYSPDPEELFCGICVGYRNNSDPYEVYVVLEGCEFLGLEVKDNLCYRAESACYANCLDRDFNCIYPTETIACE